MTEEKRDFLRSSFWEGEGLVPYNSGHCANFEHFSSAHRTSPGNSRSAVFQLDLFRILHLARLFALDAVARHHMCFQSAVPTRFVFK